MSQLTERDVLDLLHMRYSVPGAGNGPRYARAEHVKSGAGFDAPRCADFIAMDLWPSRGLHLHGHEVKVSRSDWLVELKHPEKADAFKRYMDRWWLVVSDRAIVKPGELPAGWGLMYERDGRIVCHRAAAALDPLPLPRSMLAPLLRATQVTAERMTRRNRMREKAS